MSFNYAIKYLYTCHTLVILHLNKALNILLTSFFRCSHINKKKLWDVFFDFYPVNKTPLGEIGCLNNPYFLLTGCLGIQFFDSPFPNTVSWDIYLLLPTLHCAALAWLTEHHVIPLIIKCFSSNPYPGKQKISLDETSIFKHVPLLRTKKVLHCRFYLSVRASHRTLNFKEHCFITGFELSH